MNLKCPYVLLGLALLPGPALEANQIVLPGSIQIAGSGRDHDGTAAFNAVDRTWLVVWRQASSSLLSPNSSSIIGRIVREDRTVLTAPFEIAPESGGMTAPRVAHDPLRNEWMVVYAAAWGSFDTTVYYVSARKVSAGGALIGTESRPLSTGDSGEASPDVAASINKSLEVVSSTSFFLAVWQQNVAGQPGILARRVYEDAAQSSHIGLSGAPFRVDSGANLPADRKSTRPRITEKGPFGRPSGPGGALRAENYHHVAFELESGGQKDLYLANVNTTALSGAPLRIAGTAAAEDLPEVAWNEATGRTFVLYHRQGIGVRGQLVEPGPGGLQLLGGEIAVAPGDASSIAAQAGTDIFYATASNSGNFGLGCIAGERVVGTPAAGASAGDRLSLSPSGAGNVLLAFRRADLAGATIIRASILVIPPPAISNVPPVARAGTDFQVAEGTLFRLDGSASSDPDGDPLRWLWSRTGGGNPDDFFAGPSERTQAKAQLLAPMLGPDALPVTLVFQVQTDDYRSFPAFPSTDTVEVTVVPGADPHPPVAEAGAGQTADEAAGVQLDGSASIDPDGDPLTFHWTLAQVQPPAVAPAEVAIAGADTAKPSFTAPRFAAAGGIDLTFKLTVTTPRGGKGEDTVVVHERDSINEAPTADARGPAAADEGAAFPLDGSESRDPNGDAITYHWEVTSILSFNGEHRETVDIQGADTSAPSVTAQIFNERDLQFLLTVRDPAGLQGTSTATVHVKPVPMQVTSILPLAGSPGTVVVIKGVNLYDPGTHVYFGKKDLLHEGLIKSISDRDIAVQVPSGGPSVQRALLVYPNLRGMIAQDYLDVTTDPIIVKKGAEEIQWPQPFVVTHGQITDVFLSQGVAIYPLVQQKNALVQAVFRQVPAIPAPLACVTRGTLTVIPSEGASFEVEAQNVPPAALAPTVQLTRIGEGVNFFIDGSLLQAKSYRFAIRLYDHDIEVANAISSLNSAEFKATRGPRILAVRIVPFDGGSVSALFTPQRREDFEKSIDAALAAFRRIYPMSRSEIVYWPDEVELGGIIGDDGYVHLQQFTIDPDFLFGQLDAMNELADYLDSWNNLHPDQPAQFVVGFIEEGLYGSGGTGFAVCPPAMMADIVKFEADKIPLLGPILTEVLDIVGDVFCTATLGLFCEDPVDVLIQVVLGILDVFSYDVSGRMSLVITDFSAGGTMAQEIGHNLGLVNPFEEEHDYSNVTHSGYDEDLANLTFMDVPGVFGPVFNVNSPGALYYRDEKHLPKSVMAYAPGDNNSNNLLEPKHYQRIFDYLRADFTLPIGAGAGGGQGGGGGPALRVSGGYAFRGGSVKIHEARPALETEPLTKTNAGSPLRLVFLNGAGAVLADDGLTFNLSLPLHTHGDGSDGDLEDVFAFFRATRPIPAAAARVELRFRDRAVWSLSALGAPPRVDLLSPAAGASVAPGAELVVRWSSSDPDGDALLHNVYFSLDGGAKFQTLAFGLRGTEHRWSTTAVAGSGRAVMKVTASDGFHSAEARSGEFHLGGGRPRAAILSPEDKSRWVASRPLPLAGAGRGPDGTEVAEETKYAWSSAAAGALGTGKSLLAGPLAEGIHRIRLEVSAGGGTASAEVEVTVLPDRDGDGVDDATEAAAGLDPGDPQDLFLDSDGDGLADGAEVLDFHTDPRDADVDGDGVPDGREVFQGTSPLREDSDADGVLDGADNCPALANAGQADADGDRIGDACDPQPDPLSLFRRGDSNGDGTLDITDAVSLLAYLFLGGAALHCDDAADTNDDGKLDVSDPLSILGYLFLGQADPPLPGPGACGTDPTDDPLQRCDDPAGACR